MGHTGSEAYRRAYGSKAKPTTVANKASKLKAQDNIKSTIAQYEAAIQAQAYQTPAGLRALVIQTLVNVITNDEAKDAVKVQAAKTLGTVTEVAAFTERRETKVITSSEDTKTKLLAKLRDMMKANAIDAEVIDTDSLMVELSGNAADDAPHPPATPTRDQESPPLQLHTTPHKRSQNFADASDINLQDADPTPSDEEDPPLGESK
jgi:hypothetical protein